MILNFSLISLLCIFNFALFHSNNVYSPPERVILFVIDGLHVDAPDRLDMPHFSDLAMNGTKIKNTVVLMPGHPTHGEYSRVHSSSFPNPIMMAGTVFLEAEQDMLQHSFLDRAFIANTYAYRSITDAYEFIIQKVEHDKFVVDEAINILNNKDLNFLRLHLQNTGSAGNRSTNAPDEALYRHNIWHEEAPFVHAVKEADRQLGRLVSALQDMGKWESTLLVVTSDHGQTESGWHPLLSEEAWLHPTVFHGPGIKQNHVIEWADQTDIAPTIANIMRVSVPNSNGGAGSNLKGVMISEVTGSGANTSKILKLNRILSRYMLLKAELLLKAVETPYLNTFTMRLERNFYSLDRIMQWSDMESIDSLIEHNHQIVIEMEKKLKAYK